MSVAGTLSRIQSGQDKRRRDLVTPEGLALPLTIASRGARVGALLIDMVIIFLTVLIAVIVIAVFADNMIGPAFTGEIGGAVEFVVVVLILILFLARYGYFLFFELGPRGATPGKRMLGIRVAARDGGRLTAEAVIARNLMRDVEVFIPTFYLLAGEPGRGVMGAAAFVWLLCFVLFPVFNRDRLRAGDLVAGTWVVEAPRVKLAETMSATMSAAAQTNQQFRFGEEELSVYGEHELQVLEGVLRQNNPEAMREVMFAICRKIGWEAGAGHEREFLEAFYAALRAHLERGMRFGKRKADKYS